MHGICRCRHGGEQSMGSSMPVKNMHGACSHSCGGVCGVDTPTRGSRGTQGLATPTAPEECVGCSHPQLCRTTHGCGNSARGVSTLPRGEAQRVCEPTAPRELTREGFQSDMCGTQNRWPSAGSCPSPVVAQANMRVTAWRFLL